MLGFEKIKFTKRKYSKFLEKNRIVDNYSCFLELHEKKFLKMVMKKKLPLLIRENYIVKENMNLKKIVIYEDIILQKNHTINFEEKNEEENKINEKKLEKEIVDKEKDKIIIEVETNDYEESEEKIILKKETEENFSEEDEDEEEFKRKILKEKAEEKTMLERLEEKNLEEESEKKKSENKPNSEEEDEELQEAKILKEFQEIKKKKKNQEKLKNPSEQEIPKKKTNTLKQLKTAKKFSNPLKKKIKRQAPIKKIAEPLKLCFLVHGLEASSHDLRNIRSILYQYFPKTIFILSEENEDDTKVNISTMGKRLAKEVKNYIEYYEEFENLEISFVGHSLGGLIIRASLEFLEKFKKNFKSLITICTPHLGSSSKNFLVSTGIKVLSKFKQYKSLREMCLDDKEKYLVELSKKKNVFFFDNIVFIYAYNDGYVNYESGKVLFDNPLVKKEINKEMVKNFYGNMNFGNLVKIGFFIPNVNKGFGYFIGRDAHIEILDNIFLGRLIFSQLKNYL